MEHAEHLSALVIDSYGVEVVHLHHVVRADRVGHRAGVLIELRSGNDAHCLEPLHRAGLDVA